MTRHFDKSLGILLSSQTIEKVQNEATPGRLFLLFQLARPLLGEVVDREQDELVMIDAASVQHHDATPDLLELVFDLETVEGVVVGQNVFAQFAQLRNVPLPVAKLIDGEALCLSQLDVVG